EIVLLDTQGTIYGLDPEDAWNYGVSFLQDFNLFERPGNISIDFYRTDFIDQVVVDWENPLEVSFSNLDGKSVANSFQVEVSHEIFKNLELRTAFKWYDVKTDYRTGSLQKPLQARQRFFANLGYETAAGENGAQWKFDYTLHSLGEQRLPETASNPVEFQLPRYSDPYSLMNAQVTKVFSNTFEVYVGGENLTNFTQTDPVLGSQDPFGSIFDTSIVYGPIMGRMYYAGLRYKM
ncbi:MAG TPA: TonB-dependent receptor, partial [Eudoraea sp.]|nr:TonB-dependent receptor [Eudoraea sp.]